MSDLFLAVLTSFQGSYTSYLKSIKFPKKNINPCSSYSSKCAREVHSKTTYLPISRKPDIGFLRELDNFKSMV